MARLTPEEQKRLDAYRAMSQGEKDNLSREAANDFGALSTRWRVTTDAKRSPG